VTGAHNSTTTQTHGSTTGKMEMAVEMKRWMLSTILHGPPRIKMISTEEPDNL